MNMQVRQSSDALELNKGTLVDMVSQVGNAQFREYLVDQVMSSHTTDEITATSLLITALFDEATSHMPS